jgi:anti-sigma factor RsiW
MNCHEIRELLPDLAAGMDAETMQPEVNRHIASCDDCAAHLRDLVKTMALLDEWQAPEPSPYFDTRINARLRAEMARP